MEKHTIKSKYLNREVTYVIKRSTKDSKTWLYFLDGQNIHDPKESSFGNSWKVDEVQTDLGYDFNIVGIYSFGHIERVEEYLPFEMEDEGELPGLDVGKITPKGELTGKFIVEELIPHIEIVEASSRLIGGSSMGGVMSLYLGAKYPKVFDKILAMSTAPFFAPAGQGRWATKYIKENEQSVYLDTGTNEHPDLVFRYGYLSLNRMLYGILQDRTRVKYVEAKDDEHNESFWNKRLPNALKFLFENE